MVTTNGRSFRFDSRDIVHSVGIWRSPDIINVVFGNIIGLFLLSLLVAFGFWVSGNVKAANKVTALKNECKLQMIEAGQKPDNSYCILRAKVQVSRERSK